MKKVIFFASILSVATSNSMLKPREERRSLIGANDNEVEMTEFKAMSKKILSKDLNEGVDEDAIVREFVIHFLDRDPNLIGILNAIYKRKGINMLEHTVKDSLEHAHSDIVELYNKLQVAHRNVNYQKIDPDYSWKCLRVLLNNQKSREFIRKKYANVPDIILVFKPLKDYKETVKKIRAKEVTKKEELEEGRRQILKKIRTAGTCCSCTLQ